MDKIINPVIAEEVTFHTGYFTGAFSILERFFKLFGMSEEAKKQKKNCLENTAGHKFHPSLDMPMTRTNTVSVSVLGQSALRSIRLNSYANGIYHSKSKVVFGLF